MFAMTIASEETERSWDGILDLAAGIGADYGLASIRSLVEICRELNRKNELNVAIVGRFKAGKSSFLNHFLKRDILPVGVVPVTAVVTKVAYGPEETATIHFLSGDQSRVNLEEVRSYIAESENPGNRKAVSTVTIELPELVQLRALRFVDMPGLESAFTHNTESALKWLPNVGLALVAISVDQPLSQHDIALLKTLYQYTPNISILLTKVDLVSEAEQSEVTEFVRQRLLEVFGQSADIFPYSIKPGYESLDARIKSALNHNLLADFEAHRQAVLNQKTETVLRECHDYLTLALKAGETTESQRDVLKSQVFAKEFVTDVKSELKLIVQHSAQGTRDEVAKHLDRHRAELMRELGAGLDSDFPNWIRSLDFALNAYEGWLKTALAERLVAVSATERKTLLARLRRLEKRIFQSLQNFRDRLSDQTMKAFGVPLRTTQQEVGVREPHAPDIHIGHVFDRNWELLSAILPMSLVGPLVRRHFHQKLPFMIEKNLSRLTTQWDEAIRAAMDDLRSEANRQIDELVETVGRLLDTSSNDSSRIKDALDQVDSALRAIRSRIDPK